METKDMNAVRELEAFLANLKVDARPEDESEIERQINAIQKSDGPWSVWTNPPWRDFTRELIEPGYTTTTEDGEVDTTYAEGALIIRGDTNFWMTALLPRRFEAIPLADLVQTIWPHVEKPTLYPDDGHIYWEAIGNQDMEVPGEPYELWVEYHYMSRTELERNRLSTYANEAELSSTLRSARLQTAELQKDGSDSSARYYGLTWNNGVRIACPGLDA
jgi:hypothetical protein